MKNILKNFTIILLTIFAFSSCEKSDKDTNILKIGIIQFVEHEALDNARKGFIKGLAEYGYKDGEKIKIDYKNASGDQSNCETIANTFKNENKDLILAIATPAAIAVARVTDKIPILFSAVTDTESAGIILGKNITGVSDFVPIEKQLSLIREIRPDAKNIGILSSSNEANSKFQIDIAEKECKKLEMIPKIFTFSGQSDILQVLDSMRDKIDIIFIPTDNTVASNFGAIAKSAKNMNVPIISPDKNLISNNDVSGGTYGINYFDLGKINATQADEILSGKNKPENMHVKHMETTEKIVK